MRNRQTQANNSVWDVCVCVCVCAIKVVCLLRLKRFIGASRRRDFFSFHLLCNGVHISPVNCNAFCSSVRERHSKLYNTHTHIQTQAHTIAHRSSIRSQSNSQSQSHSRPESITHTNTHTQIYQQHTRFNVYLNCKQASDYTTITIYKQAILQVYQHQ